MQHHDPTASFMFTFGGWNSNGMDKKSKFAIGATTDFPAGKYFTAPHSYTMGAISYNKESNKLCGAQGNYGTTI